MALVLFRMFPTWYLALLISQGLSYHWKNKGYVLGHVGVLPAVTLQFSKVRSRWVDKPNSASLAAWDQSIWECSERERESDWDFSRLYFRHRRMRLQSLRSGWNLHRHGERLRMPLPSTVDGQDLPDRYITFWLGSFVFVWLLVTFETFGAIWGGNL